MSDIPIGELGVAGILIIYVFKMMFDFLSRRGKPNGTNELLCEIQKTLGDVHRINRDLHDWHSITDSSGRRLWYSPQSIEKTMTKISEHITTQTAVLKELVKDNARDHQTVIEKLGVAG